jgi:hypothetical protein
VTPRSSKIFSGGMDAADVVIVSLTIATESFWSSSSKDIET